MFCFSPPSIAVCLTAVCFAPAAIALDPELACPIVASGANVKVSTSGAVESVVESPYLPEMPPGTIMLNYGPASTCGFAGTIVVGGPLSLTPGDSWYGYSTMIFQSLMLFIDWINEKRGGVQLGGRPYAMRFVWVDDRSSKQQVANATVKATRGIGADFAFGGYSSGLTKLSALQAAVDDTLMIAAGAASTSVYTQSVPPLDYTMNTTFGFFPPAGVYHDNSLSAVAAAAKAIDAGTILPEDRVDGSGPCFTPGSGGCFASLKVGFIQSAAGFTRSQCASGGDLAVKHNIEAVIDPDTGTFVRLEVARNPTTLDEIEVAVMKLRDLGVNVIVGCTYIKEAFAITSALEKIDYSPFALSFSASLGTTTYTTAISDGWWQGAYAVGPSPWHPSVPTRGALSDMTSGEFASAYANRFNGQSVSYHGAAQFGGAVALVAAIEAANSLDTQSVARELARLNLQEFYAPLSFDANNQISAGMLVLQYAPSSASEEVVFPPASVSTGKLYFPTPSWAQRRCRNLGSGVAASMALGVSPQAQTLIAAECSGHGNCTVAGVCTCEQGWTGDDCDFEEKICDPGHIATYSSTGMICTACTPGSYEYQRVLCELSDSRHYIPISAATVNDKVECPDGTAVQEVFYESSSASGNVRVQRRQGAQHARECTCQPGYFETSIDHASRSVNDSMVCTLCPEGATCYGMDFMPYAEPGYGLRANESFAFIACPGKRRCPGPDCDCIGGSLLTTVSNTSLISTDQQVSFAVTNFECNTGYLSEGKLCASCDTARGYAKALGNKCAQCKFGIDNPAYIVLGLAFAIGWYSVIRFIATKAVKSFYIWNSFVQFLGIFAQYPVPWKLGVRDVLLGCGLFNLNFDAVHLDCVLHSFTLRWLVNLLLPLVWIVTALIHYTFTYITDRVSGRKPAPDSKGFVQRYIPMWTFYLNMYFLGASSNCLKILVCASGGKDEPNYLIADPSLSCWQGEHVPFAAVGLLILPMLLLGVPALYSYVLFRLVRKKGPNHSTSLQNFGFLYARFEPQYYFFEFVELFRKVVFVASAVLGSQLQPMEQIGLSLAVVFMVLVVYLRTTPFVSDRQDVLATVLAVVQLFLLTLGMFVLNRDPAETALEFPYVEVMAWVLLAIAFINIVYVSALDIRAFLMDMRISKLTAARGIQLHRQIFARPYKNYLVYRWASAATEPEIERLRALEKAWQQAELVKRAAMPSSKAERYVRLLEDEPRMFDWVLDEGEGDHKANMGHMRQQPGSPHFGHGAARVLPKMSKADGGTVTSGESSVSREHTPYAAQYTTLAAAERTIEPDSSSDVRRLLATYVRTLQVHESGMEDPEKSFFVHTIHGELLQWMVEGASADEIQLMRDVFADIRSFNVAAGAPMWV